MKVSFLLHDDPIDGVSLFARKTAEALSKMADVRVLSVNPDDQGYKDFFRSRAYYGSLGNIMNCGDVAHAEYRPTWFRGCSRFENRFFDFRRRLRKPLVLSAHDVFPEQKIDLESDWLMGTNQPSWIRILKSAFLVGTPAAAARNMRSWLDFVLRGLYDSADAVVVHTGGQADILERRGVPRGKIHVLLHPILLDAVSGSAARAKERFGVKGKIVMTQLGFVHERKEYLMFVEALRRLPDEYAFIIGGGPFHGDDSRIREILAKAAEWGVAERVIYTGYLSAPDFSELILATDVGVFDASYMSASGSIAAWIANKIPVVAVDDPSILEINGISPGSIAVFRRNDIGDFLKQLNGVLSDGGQASRSAMDKLRDELDLGKYAFKLMAIYERLRCM